MFAVKGWSVDASSLKPQTEIFKSSKAQDGEQQTSSRKRKRGYLKEVKQNPDIRPDDVGILWQRHVEGVEPSKKLRKRSHEKQKRQRTTEDATGSYEAANVLSNPDGEKIKSSKETALGSTGEKKEKKKSKKKKHSSQRMDDDNRVEVQRSEAEKDSAQEVNSGSKRQHNDMISGSSAESQPAKLTPMQSAMRQKLISARFRHLNQTLYTEPSSKAKELFDQSPGMFDDYHTGFRQQVSVWPENPLDKFIVAIRERGKIKLPSQFRAFKKNVKSKTTQPQEDTSMALPRTSGTSVIADLGCGDARLAQSLTESGDTTVLNVKLLSYDLHAANKYITKADISKLPLKDDSVNVAILCLALMGTNWISFVEEAYRILHWKGELWVAEIKSRFGRVSKSGKPVNHSVGAKRKQIPPTKAEEAKAKEVEELNEEEVLQAEVDGAAARKEETDVSAFVQVLKRRGFVLKPPSEKSVDLRNKMFVKMEFVKALTPIKGKGKPTADTKAASNHKLKFFNDEDEDADTDDETKVLKPCLYKVR